MLFSSNYGPMGGGAAAGAAKGFDQGLTNTQNRQQKQEAWAIEKQKREDSLKRQQLETNARMADAKNFTEKYGGLNVPQQTQWHADVTNRVVEQDKELQRLRGNTVTSTLAQYNASDKPIEDIGVLNSAVNNDPKLGQSLGLYGRDPLRVYESGSTNDVKTVEQYLLKLHESYRKMTPEELRSTAQRMVDTGFLVEANTPSGKKTVDTWGTMVAMNGGNILSAQKDRALAKVNQAAGKGKKQGTRATSEVAPIEPGKQQTDTSGMGQATNEGSAVTPETEAAPVDASMRIEKDVSKPSVDLDSIKAKIHAVENPKNVKGKNKSGYEGPYQFRYKDENDAGYSIAKELGVTPEQVRNSEALQEKIMDINTTRNIKGLQNKGISVTDYTVWLAHNQGVGGANAILKGKLTPEIRKNIRNQGVKGNTDAELIANYHAKFRPKFEGTEVATAQAPSYNTGEEPYDGSTEETWLNKIAGYGDNRTALQRNMDFIAKQLGPEATMDEVVNAMKVIQSSGTSVPQMQQEMEYVRSMMPNATQEELMQAYMQLKGRKGRGGDQTKYEYQQQIVDYNHMIDSEVAKGQLDPKLAEDMKRENERRVYLAQQAGTGYTKDMLEAEQAVSNRKLWERVAKTPELMSEVVRDELQRGENLQDKENRPSEKERTYTTSAIDFAKRANEIVRDIEDTGPNNFMRGPLAQYGQAAATRSDSDMLKSAQGLSNWFKEKYDVVTGKPKAAPVTKQELLEQVQNTIGLNTKLGALTSDYLRAQSGTAVAEPEFVRLIGGVLAGLESQNPEATQKALQTFADVMAKRSAGQLRDWASRGSGYSALEGAMNLHKAYTEYGYKMPETVWAAQNIDDYKKPLRHKPSGPTTASQVPIDLRQYKAGGSYGGKAIKRAGWDTDTAERVLELDDGTIVRLR